MQAASEQVTQSQKNRAAAVEGSEHEAVNTAQAAPNQDGMRRYSTEEPRT